MTLYKQDGSDDFIEDITLGMSTSVFSDEIILEFTGSVSVRAGLNRREAEAMIAKLAQGLSLLHE